MRTLIGLIILGAAPVAAQVTTWEQVAAETDSIRLLAPLPGQPRFTLEQPKLRQVAVGSDVPLPGRRTPTMAAPRRNLVEIAWQTDADRPERWIPPFWYVRDETGLSRGPQVQGVTQARSGTLAYDLDPLVLGVRTKRTSEATEWFVAAKADRSGRILYRLSNIVRYGGTLPKAIAEQTLTATEADRLIRYTEAGLPYPPPPLPPGYRQLPAEAATPRLPVRMLTEEGWQEGAVVQVDIDEGIVWVRPLVTRTDRDGKPRQFPFDDRLAVAESDLEALRSDPDAFRPQPNPAGSPPVADAIDSRRPPGGTGPASGLPGWGPGAEPRSPFRPRAATTPNPSARPAPSANPSPFGRAVPPRPGARPGGLFGQPGMAGPTAAPRGGPGSTRTSRRTSTRNGVTTVTETTTTVGPDGREKTETKVTTYPAGEAPPPATQAEPRPRGRRPLRDFPITRPLPDGLVRVPAGVTLPPGTPVQVQWGQWQSATVIETTDDGAIGIDWVHRPRRQNANVRPDQVAVSRKTLESLDR